MKTVISVDRSFVGDRSGRRCAPPLPSLINPRVLSLSLSPFPTRLSLVARAISSLVVVFVVFSTLFERVRHHCVLHRRLSYTEPLPRPTCRCSSWPYATRKPNLKITFEFRVCALDRERTAEKEGERGEGVGPGEEKVGGFPRPRSILRMAH